MNTPVRFHPINELDDLLRGFFVRPVDFQNHSEKQLPSIVMDVHEDGDNYVVHAELPGVKKEDIQLLVEGNLISLSAEVKNVREQKDGNRVLRSERYFGKVQRQFQLAHEIDEGRASAKFSDGILEVTLPRKIAEQTSHRISVL